MCVVFAKEKEEEEEENDEWNNVHADRIEKKEGKRMSAMCQE